MQHESHATMATGERISTELTAEAKEKLKALLDESKTLNILFTGKTGVGKSSLANALVGREVSVEGETLNPETMDVFKYSADIAGVSVTIWDSPGLQDGTSNESGYLEKMAAKCKELDLVLYCTRMDDTRIRDEDYETIITLTRAFGEEIWENAIFTLTFANQVKKSVRSRDPATQINQKEFFLSRLTQWESKLKEALEKAGVSREIVRKTVVVPVGYQENLALPDRDNWLSKFWLACLQRINKRASLALLKISANRLPKEGDTTSPVDTNHLAVKDDDIRDALVGFTTISTGAAAGAVAGSIAGPPGVAVGAFMGMYVGAAAYAIQLINKQCS